MAEEMQNLDLLAAQEDVNLQRQKVGLDLGEAQGQQMIAADARRAAAQATTAGVQGLVDMGTTLFQGSDLYAGERTDTERAARKAGRQSKRLDRIEANRGLDARNRVGERMFNRNTRQMRRNNPDLYDFISDPAFGIQFENIFNN
jgi:osmotically-inducible protein OsmY